MTTNTEQTQKAISVVDTLKLALELLDKQWQCTQVWSHEEVQDGADTIREALAQERSSVEQPAQQEEKPTTREEILSMARGAGLMGNPLAYADWYPESLERFAALVAAHVRETERKPWQGLTDEELSHIYEEYHDCYGQPINGNENGWAYERAIIQAAHGIKEHQ